LEFSAGNCQPGGATVKLSTAAPSVKKVFPRNSLSPHEDQKPCCSFESIVISLFGQFGSQKAARFGMNRVSSPE
jgi:hypothetical protein